MDQRVSRHIDLSKEGTYEFPRPLTVIHGKKGKKRYRRDYQEFSVIDKKLPNVFWFQRPLKKMDVPIVDSEELIIVFKRVNKELSFGVIGIGNGPFISYSKSNPNFPPFKISKWVDFIE